MVDKNLKTLKFDKLKSLMAEGEYFDFLCPSCKEDSLMIYPMGVVVRPRHVDNSDLENSDRAYMLRLNNLPSIHKAIKETKKEDLVFLCEDCGCSSHINKNINELDLRKWIKRHLGSEPLFLGSRT